MTADLRWFHGYPYAFGRPVCRARLRAQPDDFRVDEILDIALTGEGEHVWVKIEKTSLNTRDVADAVGQFAGVNPSQIGYSGLKDKHAVCTQWLSVPIPVLTQIDFNSFSKAGCKVLHQQRHNRKLRQGTHRENRFSIRLRDVQGCPEAIESRLQCIREQGVPNAFGEQRFGFARQNITRMLDWQCHGGRRPGRHVFGLWLSAARSFLFNEILFRRVLNNTWCLPLPGDVMMLAGSHSVFVPEVVDDVLLQRALEHDIHVSAPLWGDGDLVSQGQVAELEAAALKPYDELMQFIARQRVAMHRRALRVCVPNLEWTWEEQNTLRLDFTLPSGCFATAVLRECCLTLES